MDHHTTKPLISVMMPVYNGSEFLSRSIHSVTSQTYSNWELLIIDDGSTDNSLQILQTIAASDVRIHLFHKNNDGSGNVARNLKFLCKEALGEYAFYMSQDDEIAPDCLEILCNKAQQTGADVVIPNMFLKYADNSIGTWNCSLPPAKNYQLELSGREAFYLATDFTINGFALIRTYLMRDERNDIRFYDSDEYNTRMQYLWANKVVFAPATFYYYQGNPNAITRKYNIRRFQRLKTGMMLYDAFCKEFTDKPHRLKLMVQLAHFYIDSTILLYTHWNEMNEAERLLAVSTMKEFESYIDFKGYRRLILQRLNTYERIFASCFFLFGTTRHTRQLYAIIHSIRKS